MKTLLEIGGGSGAERRRLPRLTGAKPKSGSFDGLECTAKEVLRNPGARKSRHNNRHH